MAQRGVGDFVVVAGRSAPPVNADGKQCHHQGSSGKADFARHGRLPGLSGIAIARASSCRQLLRLGWCTILLAERKPQNLPSGFEPHDPTHSLQP